MNKFLDSILLIGPFQSQTEKESRKKILVCDPASGRACVERILSTFARRAYRRPVSRGEVDGLLRFVDGGAKRTGSRSSKDCNWRLRRLWYRRISCSTWSAKALAVKRGRFPKSSWRPG